MDLWWTRQINRLRGDMQNRIPGLKGAGTDASGNPVGLARFKQAIGKPEISDDDALALIPEYAAKAEEKYRSSIPKTEAEAAAQYLHGLMTSLREQPDGVADRTFMLEIARRTQQLLRERGHDLSIADIQAIAWYYEKRLYAEQGARETPARRPPAATRRRQKTMSKERPDDPPSSPAPDQESSQSKEAENGSDEGQPFLVDLEGLEASIRRNHPGLTDEEIENFLQAT